MGRSRTVCPVAHCYPFWDIIDVDLIRCVNKRFFHSFTIGVDKKSRVKRRGNRKVNIHSEKGLEIVVSTTKNDGESEGLK